MINYPRIHHLVPGRGTRDDLVLGETEVRNLLRVPTRVEEKLDGANVHVWWEDGWLRCATRSGEGGQDRAGQLGPLRAWLATRADQLRPLLERGSVLFGEWLLLEHSIHYSSLPAFLIGLDIWDPELGWLDADQRDERLTAAGLTLPPVIHRGVVGSLDGLERLLGPSRVGGSMMEGLVVRRLDGGEPRLAKFVAPSFRQIDEAAWRSGRPHNEVRIEEASWH